MLHRRLQAGSYAACVVALALSGCAAFSDDSASSSHGLSERGESSDPQEPRASPFTNEVTGTHELAPTTTEDVGDDAPPGDVSETPKPGSMNANSEEPTPPGDQQPDMPSTPSSPETTRVGLPQCEPMAPSDVDSDLALAVEWRWSTDGEISLPLVANLDDDNGDGVVDQHDTPEVVTAGMGIGVGLAILDGATGHEKARASASPPYGTLPAIGDLDGDGVPEIVAFDNLSPAAYDVHGQQLWHAPQGSDNTGLGSITLTDLDQNGTVEVLSDDVVFDAHGARTKTLSPIGDPAPPIAADLDGDGKLEVVYGPEVYRLDGTRYCEIADAERGFPQIADLDGDGLPEIIMVGEQVLMIIEHDCSERARVSIATENPQVDGEALAPGVVADFDGDGQLEIGIGGPKSYRVFRSDLTLAWQTPTNLGGYTAGSTAFDFDGDGVLEIVFADRSRLHVFDGATGHERTGFDLPGGPGVGYPVIADVDNDGSAEILQAVRNDARNEGSVLVLGAAHGRFMPARRIWNQYQYDVSNVHERGAAVTPGVPSWLANNTFRVQARVNAAGEPCEPARSDE